MKLVDQVRKQIAIAAKQAIPGEEKHRLVVDQVVRWLDDRTHWPPTVAGQIAESVDGPILRLIVGAMVRELYDELAKTSPGDSGG